ncbi:MAG: hypothetical protein WKF28_00655 [Rubrobacteraceae bacterium]
MDTDGSAEILTEEKRAEFAALFREFAEYFPDTPQGRNHIDAYGRDRMSGRENFKGIVQAAERGEDVTDRVLLELLPHADTEANRSKGAWIHVAPAVQSDVNVGSKASVDQTGGLAEGGRCPVALCYSL